jgi:hypothetical protein
MRASFKSNEEETGGEVAEAERDILETAPAMGIFSDMIEFWGITRD